MPLGHIGLNVPNLARAREYYDGLMPLVGYELFFAVDDQFSYQPLEGKPGTRIFFYGSEATGDYSRLRTGLQHLAFIVKTRAAVETVHAWAVARGDRVVHAPKEFPEYHPGYYATFWLDPEGFMLEAVCHRDESS